MTEVGRIGCCDGDFHRGAAKLVKQGEVISRDAARITACGGLLVNWKK